MTSDSLRANGVMRHLPSGAAVFRMQQLMELLGRGSSLALLRSLSSGPKEVGDLVEETRWCYSRVSKDLSELRSAGLVQGHVLGTHHTYELTERVQRRKRNGNLVLKLTTADGGGCMVRLRNGATQAVVLLSCCLTTFSCASACQLCT